MVTHLPRALLMRGSLQYEVDLDPQDPPIWAQTNQQTTKPLLWLAARNFCSHTRSEHRFRRHCPEARGQRSALAWKEPRLSRHTCPNMYAQMTVRFYLLAFPAECHILLCIKIVRRLHSGPFRNISTCYEQLTPITYRKTLRATL